MSRLNDRQNGLEGRSYWVWVILSPLWLLILGHIGSSLGHIWSYRGILCHNGIFRSFCVILRDIESYSIILCNIWIKLGHYGVKLSYNL